MMRGFFNNDTVRGTAAYPALARSVLLRESLLSFVQFVRCARLGSAFVCCGLLHLLSMRLIRVSRAQDTWKAAGAPDKAVRTSH
jgi:hypothetical protein